HVLVAGHRAGVEVPGAGLRGQAAAVPFPPEAAVIARRIPALGQVVGHRAVREGDGARKTVARDIRARGADPAAGAGAAEPEGGVAGERNAGAAPGLAAAHAGADQGQRRASAEDTPAVATAALSKTRPADLAPLRQ